MLRLLRHPRLASTFCSSCPTPPGGAASSRLCTICAADAPATAATGFCSGGSGTKRDPICSFAATEPPADGREPAFASHPHTRHASARITSDLASAELLSSRSSAAPSAFCASARSGTAHAGATSTSCLFGGTCSTAARLCAPHTPAPASAQLFVFGSPATMQKGMARSHLVPCRRGGEMTVVGLTTGVRSSATV